MEIELAGEDSPSLHAEHVVSEVAPGVSEYFPSPQEVHAAMEVAPGAIEYFPLTQSVQVSLPVPDHLPALHVEHEPLDV